METKLKIEGMHCASCAMLIDEELEELAGVEESHTSYAKQETTVVFDEGTVELPALVETIEELGYRASEDR
jgi:copper chaperone CopZ